MNNKNIPILVLVILAVITCFCLVACAVLFSSALLVNHKITRPIPPAPTDLRTSWQKNIDDLYAFYAQYPANSNIMSGELPDPSLPIMGVFEILDQIQMEEGWVLDYVYHADGMGSYPVLYARKDTQDPYENKEQLLAAQEQCEASTSQACPDYLSHIRPNGTPLSYLQLVLLNISGEQFYLGWHANYNDTIPVATREGLEDVLTKLRDGEFGIAMNPLEVIKARSLDFAPRVKQLNEKIFVRYVTFSKWGGFIEWNLELNSDDPSFWQLDEGKILLPYDCGIMF